MSFSITSKLNSVSLLPGMMKIIIQYSQFKTYKVYIYNQHIIIRIHSEKCCMPIQWSLVKWNLIKCIEKVVFDLDNTLLIVDRYVLRQNRIIYI